QPPTSRRDRVAQKLTRPPVIALDLIRPRAADVEMPARSECHAVGVVEPTASRGNEVVYKGTGFPMEALDRLAPVAGNIEMAVRPEQHGDRMTYIVAHGKIVEELPGAGVEPLDDG